MIIIIELLWWCICFIELFFSEDNNSPVEASPGRLNRNFKPSDTDKKTLSIDNSQDKKSSLEVYQQQRAGGGGTSTGPTKDAKESGDPCEMPRTPTQNKG